MNWQLQEAKQRFSELVRRAIKDGPQVVTRHGRDAVVVIDAERYAALAGQRQDFKEFLRRAPDLERLRIKRDRSKARRVKL